MNSDKTNFVKHIYPQRNHKDLEFVIQVLHQVCLFQYKFRIYRIPISQRQIWSVAN